MSLGASPSFDSMSSFPGGFASGLLVQNMPILNTYPGRVFWMDSVNGSDGNRGTFARPFASLAGALTIMASPGPVIWNDVLMVKPGHKETITGSATLSLNASGVQIIGLGMGSSRPTINFSTANTATLNITASNLTMQNFLFTGNFLSVGSAVTMGGATAATGNVTASTSSITGNILTTSAVTGYFYPGSTLSSATAGFVPGTIVSSQLTGVAGGAGTYTVNQNQTVASGTITTVCRQVSFIGCEFRDTSSILGFLTLITTGATNNQADGLAILNCQSQGLSVLGTAPVVVGGNLDYLDISSNFFCSTGPGTGASILAKTSKVCKALLINANVTWRPDTANTGGQGISTTSTTDTGAVMNNQILGGTAATGLLMPVVTPGTLGFANNYVQQLVDRSSTLLPAVG